MRIGTGLLIILGLCSSTAVLQAMHTAAADTPSLNAAAGTGPSACRGMDTRRAHDLADVAFREAQYQRAGQCYLIAGDKPRADLAFIRAAAAEAPGTRRQMAANATQVKTQFRQFREAFTAAH